MGDESSLDISVSMNEREHEIRNKCTSNTLNSTSLQLTFHQLLFDPLLRELESLADIVEYLCSVFDLVACVDAGKITVTNEELISNLSRAQTEDSEVQLHHTHTHKHTRGKQRAMMLPAAERQRPPSERPTLLI